MRESRLSGSVRAKAEWLSYSTGVIIWQTYGVFYLVIAATADQAPLQGSQGLGLEDIGLPVATWVEQSGAELLHQNLSEPSNTNRLP